MAFQYRNTLDSSLSALPQKYSDQILAEVGDQIETKLNNISKLFSFRVSPEVQELLANHGLELAPISYQNHSHPACKMIENHFLYVTLPNMLKKEHSIGLMSLREEKKKRFIKMRRCLKAGEFQGVEMFNSIIEAKDFFRYEDDAFIGSFDERVESIRGEFARPGFNARTMLIHDELHHHSPKEILHLFDRVPELKSVVCTTVCPSELLLGEKKSKNPRIYGFEIRGETLSFFPDNNPSEGYEQNLANSLWPLTVNKIKGCGLELRVTVIASIFAHHLVVIDRDVRHLKKRNFFLKPSCLLKEEIDSFGGLSPDAQVERATIQSIIVYLNCLKTPNRESAIAKLRQIEKRALFDDELNLISEISGTFSELKKDSSLTLSRTKKLMDSICGKFPWFLSFFDEERVWQCCFREFNKKISVKWFEIELQTLDTECSLEVFTKVFSERLPNLLGFCSARAFFEKFTGFLVKIKGEKLTGGVPYISALGDKETNASVVGEVIDLCPLKKKKKKKVPEAAWVNAFDCPPGSLQIEYKPDISTEDNGTRNGVAFSLADLTFEQEVSTLKDEKRKNSCVFRTISSQIGVETDDLLYRILQEDITDELLDAIHEDKPLNLVMLSEVACVIGRSLRGFFEGNEVFFGSGEPIFINLSEGHCSPLSIDYISKLKREPEIRSLPSLGSVTYEIETDRAMRLLKSFLRGTTGVMARESESFKDELKVLEPLVKNFQDRMCSIVSYLWGAPGSGKTRALIQRLKGDDNIKAAVVSPRRLLADDWFSSIQGSNSRVFTFETFLAKDHCFSNCLILDEISLMPPGYLDLAIIKIFSSRVIRKRSASRLLNNREALQRKFSNFIREFQIILIGDPMQARYYSENDEILLSRKHDIDKVVEYGANKTLWRSHRMGSWFEKYVDIPCIRQVADEPRRFYSGLSAIKDRKYDAILCAGREDKRDLAGSIPVYTFGESQGLTFNRVLIALTGRILNCNDYHFFVGITRSIKPFDFIVIGETPLAEYVKRSERKLMGYVLKEEKISRDRLSNLFPCKKVDFVTEEVFGTNIQNKSCFDLFIQPFCPLYDIVKKEVAQPDEEVEDLVIQKCHLPISYNDPINEIVFERMKEKFQREAWSFNSGFSEQFTDFDKNCFLNELPAPFRMEAIFPRHQASDSTTFLMGVKKRLRFSNCVSEENELRANMENGSRLADFFLRNLPERFYVDHEDIEDGLNDFVDKRMLKQSSQWENHSNRSDIDWPLNYVFMFMKSQLCTKAEKMFSDAKAGQTLACFQHIVLFRMGPMLRAIEKGFSRACGEKFYVHSMKNFDSLNKFVTTNADCFTGGSIESDYEAFDSSQDSLVLAFELSLLRRLGVPNEFINDYRSLKVNLGSRLGNFAIMRFTGEFCTFLFNTFANMLFTFLKYEIKPESRILFAGDDMASIGRLRKNDFQVGHQCMGMLDRFRLKAKEEKKDFPIFCGWILTPDGIYKKPSLLWARIKVMRERGSIKECIDNYLLEMNWAYRLGELLYTYLDEFEMDCHYKCVRFFIENSSMCRGESVKVLKTFGFCFGNNSRGKEGSKCDLNVPRGVGRSFLLKALQKSVSGLNLGFSEKIIDSVQGPSNIGSMDFESKKKFSLMLESLKNVEGMNKYKSDLSFLEPINSPGGGSFVSEMIRKGNPVLFRSMKDHFGVELVKKKVVNRLAGIDDDQEGHTSSKDNDEDFSLASLGQTSHYLKRRVLMSLNVNGIVDLLPGKSGSFFQEKVQCLLSGSIISILTPVQMLLKLTQSTHATYIKMQALCTQKYSNALGDLSQTSRCMGEAQMANLLRISRFLMTMKLDGSVGRVTNTVTYISGQLSSASTQCSQMLRELKGGSQSLMIQCSLQGKGILLHMKSVSTRVLQSSYYNLHIVFQLLIRILNHASRLFCNFLSYQGMRVESFLELTSEFYSGYQTLQDSLKEQLSVLVGASKKLPVAFCQSMMRTYKGEYSQLQVQKLNQLTLLVPGKKEVLCCLRELQERGLTELFQGKERVTGLFENLRWRKRNQKTLSETQQMAELLQQIWGNLGLPQLDLITKELSSTTNMSVQEVLKGEIRARVRRFLWENFVDPEGQLIVLPADGGLPAGEDLVTYNRISEYHEKFLFGNIAIVGTSMKVVWPSVSVAIPRIEFRVGELDVNWQTELVLSDVCPRLEAFRSACEYIPLRRMTFRGMCEAFASEARLFLNERRQFGVFTNIYGKWPRAFESAPQVAFDFAGGLNMHELTADERTVIDRMTKRLFRTEGQKMVFSAQGEVNLTLEG